MPPDSPPPRNPGRRRRSPPHEPHLDPDADLARDVAARAARLLRVADLDALARAAWRAGGAPTRPDGRPIACDVQDRYSFRDGRPYVLLHLRFDDGRYWLTFVGLDRHPRRRRAFEGELSVFRWRWLMMPNGRAQRPMLVRVELPNEVGYRYAFFSVPDGAP